MTTKHTKGEWYIDRPDFETINIITALDFVCEIPKGVGISEDIEERNSEAESNAKLICNAPNMLETLEVILKNFKLNFLHKTPVTMQELEAGINIIQHTINKATN